MNMIHNLPHSLIEAAKKILTEGHDKIYYRGTNNKDEEELIQTGKIHKSKNHITGKYEKGLSVSDTKNVGEYFKFLYTLSGKEIGVGSDGEPVLDVGSLKFKNWINESDDHPMIDVDGDMKHRHNSNGVPIHPTDEGIRNFHRWFGDSKTVDEHGRPKVFYHGTDASFDEFKPTKGTVSTAFGSEHVDRHGHFFTDDKDLAKSFSNTGKTMPVYLKMHKPLDMRNGLDDDKLQDFENHGFNPRWFTHSHLEDWERFDGEDGKDFTHTLGKMGHDSAIINEPSVEGHKGGHAFVVFHPHQIKSATDNNGDFHPDKNRITENKESGLREEHYNFNFWKRDAKKFGMNVVHEQKTSKVGKPLFEDIEVWFAEDTNKKCHGVFFKGGGTNYGHLIHEKEEEIPQEIIESFLIQYCFESNNSIPYCIDELSLFESLDTKYDFIDATNFALQQKPEIKKQNEEFGITHYKVEYHPDTSQIFTTYYRDGAWEIHHQVDDKVGKELKSKNPPMGFSAHVLGFIKNKLENNEKVRINGTKEMIPMFHKKASSFSKRLNAGVTDIEKGVVPHQTGFDIHEFLMYPNSLKECLLPLQFINPHEKIRFLKEQFGDIKPVIEYNEKLRKQGHDV